MKISRLLIANRGEIACRIIRTCRRLGIRAIAVHSEADRGALHVRLADEAHAIGPAPARESYLNQDAVLAAARAARADAIHPGYGFLSENASFAEACAAAGIVFVGPPPAAIRAMGLKHEAKALVSGAGVPVVPGYMGDDQSAARLAAEAARVGYPLLVKAVAGGGGKGMRVVREAAALDEAIRGARGEAESAFGDGRLLLERFLERPRHVEVQVFGDAHGGCVHLFERECSVQRRYQKIIEESPSPFIDARTR
ncbi:MAG TPA: biotin carboxylase N-terminal domain-containing protein, partial [Steroidobacteraceae bacterium]|nr:biotin carboxylase N-terminal domain-containing protein [Steroidobacteraceae bacterium]